MAVIASIALALFKAFLFYLTCFLLYLFIKGLEWFLNLDHIGIIKKAFGKIRKKMMLY
jgi:hypothetical protein